MTGTQPTPARMDQPVPWPDPELAEPARVLGVIHGFFTARPAARDSLARFAFAGLHAGDGGQGRCFWTDELLDYLDGATTDLAERATGRGQR